MRSSPKPSIAALAAEIDFLYGRLGVTYERIADFLGTSAAYCKLLKHQFSISSIPEPLPIPQRGTWKDRSHTPTIYEGDASATDLLAEAASVVRSHSTQDFESGIRELNAIKSKVGQIHSFKRKRLLARLHQHSAWFHSQMGYSGSALRNAITAIPLYRELISELNDPWDYRLLNETLLVSALSWRVSGYLDKARSDLDEYEAICKAFDWVPGSEYYLQKAVITSLDDRKEALNLIQTAAAVMRQKQEVADDLQIRLRAERTENVLNTDPEHALELNKDLGTKLGERSLPVLISANCALAAALGAESELTKDALQKLIDLGPSAPSYPHQSTVRSLLLRTPRLKLSKAQSAIWSMRVLSANEYRTK